MNLSKASLGEALASLGLVRFESDRQFEAAARFVERLLPGECDCDLCLDGSVPAPLELWDEGLVEVVAQALREAPIDDPYEEWARAVLAALAAEVGK